MSTEPPHPDITEDTITWPTDQDEMTGVRAAATVLLYMYQSKWIHRRVEAIKFDQNETCRYESVDFSLPPEIVNALSNELRDDESSEANLVFVPISSLDKMPLAKLDIWDARARRLCTLIRHDNEQFSMMMLRRTAETVFKETLDESTETVLRTIVTKDESEILQSILPLWSLGTQGRLLLLHPLTREMIFTVATSRPMLVPVRLTTDRQLVKYSYATDTSLSFRPDWYERPQSGLSTRGRFWFWLKQRILSLRWWYWPLRFDISRAVLCSSYHFEIRAPEGFGIRDVRVVKPEQDGSSTFLDCAKALFPTRANITLSQHTDPVPQSNMRVECGIRLPRSGLLNFAWVTTLVTAIALIVVGLCASHLVGKDEPTDAGAAVLLTLAPLTNLWLGRPEVNKDFGSMLVGLRLLLLLSGAAGLGGIALLLDWVDSFYPGWFIVSAVASLAFLSVSIGRALTGPDPDQNTPFVRVDILAALIIVGASWLIAWIEDTRLFWSAAVVIAAGVTGAMVLRLCLERWAKTKNSVLK
jgi:hypothetical protein